MTGTNILKKIISSSLIRSLLFILVCVLGMGLSLWFFRLDLDLSQQQLVEEPIGTVYWVERTAQRLSAGHVQWERMERFAPVYNGDLISTAPFSELKINFINNETLECSENSVIRIHYKIDEIPQFEILKGDIKVYSSRYGLTVNILENMLTAQTNILKTELAPNTSAGINVQEDLTLRIFQGSGVLSYGGEFRNLTAGQAVRTGKSSFQPAELAVMMLSPRDGTSILRTTPEEQFVKFQWQGADTSGNQDSENGIRLEIYPASDTDNPAADWYGRNTDSTEIALAEGFYIWNLYRGETYEILDSGKLDIINITRPLALSPADGSAETILAGKQNLNFYWAMPEEAEAVLLEVADNPEMNQPRIRQLINGIGGTFGSHIASEIGPGKWYWRVHPIYPGGVSGGDNILSQMTGNHGFWRIRPANTDVMADDRPSPVNSFTVTEAAASPARTLVSLIANTVAGYSPQITFPADSYTLETDRTPDLLFIWKNPVLFNARFQIAERSDFAGSLIMDEQVFGSSIRGIFLEAGSYYWRVIGSGPGGRGESRPVRLVVEPSLKAPVLVSPADEESILIETGRTLSFSWQKPFYADYYMYRLFLEGRSAPLTEINFLENTSIQVTFDPNTSGNFLWTVQGFTSATESTTVRSGLISTGRFTINPRTALVENGNVVWSVPRIENIEIRQGEVQAPITLLSPVSGSSIPGMEALRSPPYARWTTLEPIRNAQLLISSTTNPSGDSGVIKVDASAGSGFVRFPSLEAGIWYWIIQGDTIDMRGAVPGSISWFRVLPIPQLPAPLPILPEINSVIGIEQLTRDRNITFIWAEVEQANAYVFSLFLDGTTPVRLVNTNPQTASSYIFDDLVRLGEGNYYWQVEAVFRNENGVLEQRGIIENHAFSIQIERSTGLQTQSQGTLWGQ